jgi:hypothetical protein
MAWHANNTWHHTNNYPRKKNKTRPFTTNRESMCGTQVYLSPACVFLEDLKIPKHAHPRKRKNKPSAPERAQWWMMPHLSPAGRGSIREWWGLISNHPWEEEKTLDHGAGRGQETHYYTSRRLSRFS